LGFSHSFFLGYDDFRFLIEFGAGRHGAVHCFIGGHMCGDHSPHDPLFFVHHTMVDKIWDEWQKINPANAEDYATGSYSLDDVLPPYGLTGLKKKKENILGIYLFFL